MAVGFTLFYRRNVGFIKLVFKVLLAILALLTLGLNLDYFGFFGAEVYWVSVLQWTVSDEPVHSATISTLNIYLPSTGLTLAVLSSAATVYCLVRRDESSSRPRSRGTVTVIYMNLGLIIYLIALIFATFYLPFDRETMPKYLQSGRYEMYYGYYLVGSYLPLVLAVYNPLIVAIRCHGTKSLAAKWLVSILEASRICRHSTVFKSFRDRAAGIRNQPESTSAT